MDSTLVLQIIFLIILLIASAFFSSSETALMTISKIDTRYMIEQGLKNSKMVENLVENRNKVLGAILVGNNIVNIGASSLATVIATSLFENIGIGITIGVMTIFILIFGEIAPKSLSTQKAQQVACFVSKYISIWVFIFDPVVEILMSISNSIVKFLGGNVDTNKPFITTDELKTILMVSHEEGVIETSEKEMIYNVFSFGDSYAKDIMVPRTDMVAINVDSSYEEIIAAYTKDQFSRMPIYQDSYDNIIGIIYMKDLILTDFKANVFHVEHFKREVFFVHEYKRIDEILKEMRAKKLGMAIVLDEYGGTAGLITLEDIIEQIVGDIDDEYDLSENSCIKETHNEYLIDGSLRISEFNERLNLNISSKEFDSIGGFIIGFLDRFPREGEEICYDNIIFKIEQIENNRVQKIRVILN